MLIKWKFLWSKSNIMQNNIKAENKLKEKAKINFIKCVHITFNIY